MIEVKTLCQSLKSSHIQSEDMELQSHLSDGWEILNITVGPETSTEYANRYVTMKREASGPAYVAPTLPSNVIESWIAFDEASSYLERCEEDKEGDAIAKFNQTRAMFLTYFGDYIEAQS